MGIASMGFCFYLGKIFIDARNRSESRRFCLLNHLVEFAES